VCCCFEAVSLAPAISLAAELLTADAGLARLHQPPPAASPQWVVTTAPIPLTDDVFGVLEETLLGLAGRVPGTRLLGWRLVRPPHE